MTTLLLIRHGDNDYLKNNKLPGRLPGIHLNEHGREQAAEVARCLGQMPIKVIYSSPLERAVETAGPLAQTLGLDIQLRPDLADIDVGEWANRSWKTLRRTKYWKIIQLTPSQFQFPGGESFQQAQERIVRTLDEITSAHKKEKGMVAVVFHADPIKLALTHHLGMPLDNFQRLTIFPGSVTVLSIDDGIGRLISSNLIPPFAFPKP